MVDMEDMDTAIVAMDTMARGKLNQLLLLKLMLPQDMVIMVTPPMGMVVTDTVMDMDIMEREKLRLTLLLKLMLLQDILITVTLLMVMVDMVMDMDMVMVMDIMARGRLMLAITL